LRRGHGPSAHRHRLLQTFDPGGDDLRHAARAGTAPVEAADELPVHEDAISLGDPVERVRSDRGVPRRDREGEEALARLRNGEPELGQLRYSIGVMWIT
jgi:hypothetical protein